MNDKDTNNQYPNVSDRYKIEYIDYPHFEYKKKRSNNFRPTIFRYWKRIILSIVVILIISNIVSHLGSDVDRFPKLAEPKTITFAWEYKGLKYSITETLYKTVYDYYRLNSNKKSWSGPESYEDITKIFLTQAKEDNTISQIASDIRAEGLERGLKGDQLIELALSFVQSIPYDHAQAELLDSSSKNEDLYPSYPYEVLYKQTDICSGKSFLAASLIKEFGYGVAFFHFIPIDDNTGHIATAVKCPLEYSSYNSSYCFAETTGEGFKIGEIPDMDANTNMPQRITAQDEFSQNEQMETGVKLSSLEIYQIADGNSYQEIINTTKTLARIDFLKNELSRIDKSLLLMDGELNLLSSSIETYKSQFESIYKDYQASGEEYLYKRYLEIFSQYKTISDRHDAKLDEYNAKVDEYNAIVEEYNVLLNDYQK